MLLPESGHHTGCIVLKGQLVHYDQLTGEGMMMCHRKHIPQSQQVREFVAPSPANKKVTHFWFINCLNKDVSYENIPLLEQQGSKGAWYHKMSVYYYKKHR